MKDADECAIGKEVVRRWEALSEEEIKEYQELSKREHEARKRMKEELKAAFAVSCKEREREYTESLATGARYSSLLPLPRYEETTSVGEKEG